MRWILFIFSIFFFHSWNIEALLLNLQKPCVPTTSVKGPCHTCVCNADAVFDCHAVACENLNVVNPRKSIKDECEPLMTYRFEDLFCTCNYKGKWMSYNCRETFQFIRADKTIARDNSRSNITSKVAQINHNELPDIQEGQSCVPGKIYKLSCNTCRCGHNNTLICTKMACLENTIRRKIDYPNTKARRSENVITNNKQKKTQKSGKKSLPKVPKGDCVPGKLYRKGCKKCFCNEEKVAVCAKICKKDSPYLLNDDEISQVETRPIVDLQELPHIGAECVPGKSYYVTCNLCVCTSNHDLVCTKRFCLDFESFETIHANKLTGTSCKKDYKELCTECKCVKEKSECKTIKPCNITSQKQLLSSAGNKIKLTLDAKKEKCEPNAAYKVHCNECYCQSDGTLRCTQRVCLSFSQTKNLKEREKYLEKYGL